MPFYISQIAGTQIPYEPLSSAELRELGRPEYLRQVESEQPRETPLNRTESRDNSTQKVNTNTQPVLNHTAISHGAASVSENKSAAIREGQLRPDPVTYSPDRLPIAPVQKTSTTSEDFSSEEVDNKEAIDAYRQAKDRSPRPARVVVEIGEIMTTPVITLNERSTVEEVWQFIQERRFRHVPIVNDDDKLLGIVSDRDFIRLRKLDSLSSIREIITTNIITARPETDIRSAAKLMFDERIGALPIVDEKETLVGIVTRSDILRVLYKRAPLELWL